MHIDTKVGFWRSTETCHRIRRNLKYCGMFTSKIKNAFLCNNLQELLRRGIGVKLVTLFSSSKVISKLKDSSSGGLLDWKSDYCELWSKRDGSRSGNERDVMCVN